MDIEIKKLLEVGESLSFHKGTDFFLNYYNRFSNIVSNQQLRNTTNFQFECRGYGVFEQQLLVARFFEFLSDFLKDCSKFKRCRPQCLKDKDILKQSHKNKKEEKNMGCANCGYLKLRSLKIIFNGVNISENYVGKLTSILIQSLKCGGLHKLIISTSNLTGCDVTDFQKLFHLFIDLKDEYFEDFSLHCANWQFAAGQPKLQLLKNMFNEQLAQLNDLLQLNQDINIKIKHFQLEISGWYNTKQQVMLLLSEDIKNKQDFKAKVQKFHDEIKQLVDNLLKILEYVEDFKLDMRNYHQLLKMKDLKKMLDNTKAINTFSHSIITKMTNKMLHQIKDEQNDGDEKNKQRELKLTILVN